MSVTFVAGVLLAAAVGLVHWLVQTSGGSRALVRYLVTEDGVARPGRQVYLWRNYSHVMLLEDGPGAWRLHLYPTWWRLLMGPPIVNARLECDDRQAEAVRHEIQRRINAARTAEADEALASGRRPRRWW